MNAIGVKYMQLLKLSAARNDLPGSDEGFTRQNSYTIVQLGEKNAELLVEDSLRVSFDKEFSLEFACQVKVVVGYAKPMKEDTLREQINKWIDQPVLSHTNLVMSLVLDWMGLLPISLPPVWSVPAGVTKGKVRKGEDAK